jgi:hypothetical protein
MKEINKNCNAYRDLDTSFELVKSCTIGLAMVDSSGASYLKNGNFPFQLPLALP